MLERLQKYLESIGLRRDATEEQAQAFLASLSEDRARVANLLELEASSDTGRIAARAALAEMGLDPDTLNRRAADPPEGPEGDGNSQSERNDDRAVAQARETERARIREIHRIAGSDLSEEQVQRAIDEDWSLDRVRQEALDSLRRGSQPLHTGPGSAPAGHVRSHETDCTRETLAYGLMLRGGIETIDPSASEQRREEQARLSEQAHRYSDLSLVDICREAIRVDGGRTPVGRSEAIRAAVSGGTLSYVFTTSAYAAVLMGYQEADDTTDWCSVEDVPNFMEHDAIQLDKTSLDKHPRGGTAKHAAPSDTREQYRAQRYSKQFVIDEMDILDDRLGAIVGTVPREMGAAAARLRSDLVYAEILANEALADTGALFNSTAVTTAGGHANLGTSALAAAALGAATTAMMQQKQSGVRLNLRPRYLVVNPTLEWTARELVSSGEIIVAGDTDTVRGARNVLRDLNLQVRVEGRLDASGVTDPDSGTAYTGSATAWYLFSAPGKTIHVVYRAGTGRRPSLRRFVLDQGQWGIGWDINMDVGVKALDYRGCYCGKA